jgi:signal transduction histidine kinase
MPWDRGPCAIIVVSRHRPEVSRRGFVATLLPTLVVSAAAVLIAVIAVGPVVRRVRRLTEAVRRTGTDTEEPIEDASRDEVGELARAFETSRRELHRRMQALRQRDEMLTSYMANTTHDVMVPLTVIQGHLVAVEQQLARGVQPERATVEAALEEVHYLGSLVHNLSAATKLEAGDALRHRHRVDLGPLVERVAGRHAPIARQREVELNHSVPESSVLVMGDETLIEQAVSNLVHNAVRYGNRGGHVAVVLEAPKSRFRLRVVDDGPGIPQQELSRVAERHFRGGQARTRNPQGLGLGLHIVRNVAEQHDFELTFRAPDDGGLEVTLSGATVEE